MPFSSTIRRIRYAPLAIGILFLCALPPSSPSKSGTAIATVTKSTGHGPAVLWHDPDDIHTRNLFYGSGGQANQPLGPFTFVREDLEGSNPKIDVVDRNGTKWKVKMGVEARPETAASRLVWAVGYYTEEDYFVPMARIKELPRLQRGRRYVVGDTIDNVRLKHAPEGEKKIGTWAWANDAFTDTREWYGLRVLMAVMNNWDLKDVNNAILERRGDHPEQIYLISDLGASFGTVGFGWTRRGSKGNLKAYEHSRFIKQVSADAVSFYVPARAALDHFFPRSEWRLRLSLRWLGQDIPREDARWMGDLLGRLSDQQIKDAFRAADYSNVEVDRFSRIVEERIAELRRL